MLNKLVVWGGCGGDLASHRHIHRAFHATAGKLGIKSVWVDDQPESQKELTPGATVIVSDVWANHIIYQPDVDYVVHNFNGDHPIFQQIPPENVLRLQVYTDDAFGEVWDHCRLYSREGRTLFQPWGTDLLAEEFMDPVLNALSNEVAFVGAIWGEASPYGELGNIAAINELKQVVATHGLTFTHLTQVPDRVVIETTRKARLAPAFAGAWQVAHNYLPCRIFKNSSYGALMVTNVPKAYELYGDAHVPGDTVEEMVTHAVRLKRKESDEMIRAQQRVTRRYTYRESLGAIERALEEGK